jgi:hypothetical protein
VAAHRRSDDLNSPANRPITTSNDPEGYVTKVKVRANNEVRLRLEDGSSTSITADFLAKNVPGVMFGKRGIIKAKCLETGATFYSCYRGGGFWYPGLPSKAPLPKRVLSMAFQCLKTECFLHGLTQLNFANSAGLRWMPSFVSMTEAILKGTEFTLCLLQDPEV